MLQRFLNIISVPTNTLSLIVHFIHVYHLFDRNLYTFLVHFKTSFFNIGRWQKCFWFHLESFDNTKEVFFYVFKFNVKVGPKPWNSITHMVWPILAIQTKLLFMNIYVCVGGGCVCIHMLNRRLLVQFLFIKLK